jgi:hypothetical protein
VFFRSRTLDDALYIVGNLVRDLPAHLGFVAGIAAEYFRGHLSVFSELTYGGKPLLPLHELVLSCALIGFLVLIQLGQRHGPLRDVLARRPIWVRWAAYYAGIVALTGLGVFHGAHEFIYFQF